MFKGAWRFVAQKELKDALRDRNAILMVVLFPLLGPIMIYFMFNQVIKMATDFGEVSLSVSGYEYATDLVDYLQQNGIEVKEYSTQENGENTNASEAGEDSAERSNEEKPAIFEHDRIANVQSAIESRRLDYVLVVPSDFEKKISESKTVNLELHFESSRNQAQAKVGRVQQLINAWAKETSVLRLMARGVNPAVIEPINLVRIDVASKQARAQRIMSMIPMFTLMAAFVCGIGVAVDATAGERERKSLEPLLVNPLPRMQLVLGKWLVATLFSISGLCLITILNLIVLDNIPLAEIGLVLQLGSNEILGILITLAPIALLVTSMQMFVGMLARSFKEAQGYIGLMNMLPMFPFFMNVFNNQGRELWMTFVPVYGQYMLLEDVVSGKTPEAWEFVLSAGVIAVFTVVFLLITARLFKRERIIFS